MAVTRRKLLQITGGGVILAATGAAAFLGTRTPTKALLPWEQAGTYTEPRRRALSYAILAPNPHNRQPWEVDLSEENTIFVWRDKQRNLPETDPLDRQLTIGMGCFLELLTMAAGEDGYAVETDLFPEGVSGPVAVVRFKPGGNIDPLFAHVMSRRSCKEPFESRAVTKDQITTLESIADVHATPSKVAQIKALTVDAWLVEVTTRRTMKESVDLFRLGKSEINANPDGIDLGGPFLETVILLGMLTREGQLDTTSSEFEQGKSMYEKMLISTPAYASITSKTNTRADQIEAGRRWLRLNLLTTSLGLALHPVSQALQEYPEMEQHYRTAHEMLAAPGHTVQMLGRLGYGPLTPRTPRWQLDSRIINA
ncbi:MAG: hypothetical protein ACI9XK_004199 [Granulosicoccus sp.]|jgi:hypothetical protein